MLIGSQHGHELLGDNLWAHIKLNHPRLLQHLEFVIANPEAKKKGVRLIESDMNRSYNNKNTTYEEKLASELLAKSRSGDYAFALDLHTTTVGSEPIIITANFKYTWKFIKSSGIKKIVKMPKKIALYSYIGNFPTSVSIELNEKDAACKEKLGLICDDIERFIMGTELDQDRKFYIVESYLKKVDDATNNTDGLIPFLVGEKTYYKNQYVGFMAKSIIPPYGKNKKRTNK